MSYLKHKPGSIEELMANEASKLNDNAYQDMFKKELDKAGKGIGSMTPAEKKAFFNKIDDKYKAKNENIKEGRYEVTGTVTYQGVSGEDEVTVVVDAMDKMDAEDVADDMIDDLRRAKKIGPKRGGQVKRFDPFDVEYTRKKEGLVDKMMEKNEEVSKVVPAGSHKMPDGTIMKDKDHKKEVKEEDAYDKDDEKPKSKPKKETHTFMTKDMNKSKKDAKGEKEIVDPEPKIKQESLQDAIKSVWQLSAEELEKMKSEAKYMKAQRMNQYKAEDEKNKKGTADTGSKATKVDVEPSVDYKN
jgi:hypothetical protein